MCGRNARTALHELPLVRPSNKPTVERNGKPPQPVPRQLRAGVNMRVYRCPTGRSKIARACRRGRNPHSAHRLLRAQQHDTRMDDLMEVERRSVKIFEDNSPSVVFCAAVSNVVVRTRSAQRKTIEKRGTGSGEAWKRFAPTSLCAHRLSCVLSVLRAHDKGLLPWVSRLLIVVWPGATHAEVTLASGRIFSAEVVGCAPDKDIAVLRIDGGREALRPVVRPAGVRWNPTSDFGSRRRSFKSRDPAEYPKT
eukprot:1074163-Prorocentrum_minimum.AAC.2